MDLKLTHFTFFSASHPQLSIYLRSFCRLLASPRRRIKQSCWLSQHKFRRSRRLFSSRRMTTELTRVVFHSWQSLIEKSKIIMACNFVIVLKDTPKVVPRSNTSIMILALEALLSFLLLVEVGLLVSLRTDDIELLDDTTTIAVNSSSSAVGSRCCLLCPLCFAECRSSLRFFGEARREPVISESAQGTPCNYIFLERRRITTFLKNFRKSFNPLRIKTYHMKEPFFAYSRFRFSHPTS